MADTATNVCPCRFCQVSQKIAAGIFTAARKRANTVDQQDTKHHFPAAHDVCSAAGVILSMTATRGLLCNILLLVCGFSISALVVAAANSPPLAAASNRANEVPAPASTNIRRDGHLQLKAKGALQRVPEAISRELPLRAIGQLANGCTGFLVGPCHVMTVAHCVYEPWKKIWWHGLNFYAGRNVPPDHPSAGWSPLGTASKKDVVLHPNWTSDASGSKGKPAADAAIIITNEPVGTKLGWLDFRLPKNINLKAVNGAAGAEGGGCRTSGAADDVLPCNTLEQLVLAAGVHLQVAGYPDDKPNGSMWWQCCQPVAWGFQGNLLWHDCHVRGGNSGSPVWIEWPASALNTCDHLPQHQHGQQQQHGLSQQPAAPHMQQDSQHKTLVQVVGLHSSSLKFPVGSDIGAYAEAVYKDEMLRRGTGHSIEGLSGINGQCVVGAGGREADGDNTLLPVAVPFTDDTYKWIEDVLQRHNC